MQPVVSITESNAPKITGENLPLKVAVVGTGIRGRFAYSPFAKQRPDLMKLVAGADINPTRLKGWAKDYGVPENMLFESGEEFFKQPKMADVVIIATMDRDHYGHAIAALEKGYDVLLEKPISPVPEEFFEIAATAKRLGRKVAICHVLRYSMFFRLLKFYIDSGRIGDLVDIQHIETVGYWHQAHSFVRGNWGNADKSSPMIMQKCCHDMDILYWLAGCECKSVSSYGSLKHFRPEGAPPGATERCLDCPAKAGCQYDAEKIYVKKYYGCVGNGMWPTSALTDDDVNLTNVYKALREGPYGKCVYHTDNNVVDHQVVNMQFDHEITAQLTMVAFSETMSRTIRVFGTRGEIFGDMEKNEIVVRTFGQPEEHINVADYTSDFSGHAGGDNVMMEEFLLDCAGMGKVDQTLTSVDVSIHSHLMALAAEQSRLNGGMPVSIEEFAEEHNKF